MTEAHNKTSTIIEDQFPDFVRSEGPNFVAFLKAYYEWMEETGNVTDAKNKILSYRDIDRTIDDFIEYFRTELLQNIPTNVLANKRTLAKNIIDFYRAKGSEKSYRLLFRMLYNDEIDFYYPGQDILRPSSGKWIIDRSIRVIATSLTADVFSLLGQDIIGTDSRATAKVENVIQYNISSRRISEIFLTDISGTFIPGEYIVTDLTEPAVIRISGVFTSVTINTGGAGHHLGDAVSFISSGSGVGANGYISNIGGGLINFSLTDGGYGYTNSATVSVISLDDGSGADLDFTVGNYQTYTKVNDIIRPLRNVVLNTGPTFTSLGSNSSIVTGPLATANISTVLSAALSTTDYQLGEIISITTTAAGQDYTLSPRVIISDPMVTAWGISDGAGGYFGNNAVIDGSITSGRVAGVSVNNPGIGYANGETLTIRNLSNTSATDATGSAGFDALFVYPGKYLGTDGFLSSDKKLQDSRYYQEYSYVLKTGQYISHYRDTLKKLLHPAGTALFGEIQIVDTLDLEPELDEDTQVVEYTLSGDIQISFSNTIIGLGTSFLTDFANGATVWIKDTSGIGSLEDGIYKIGTVIDDQQATLLTPYGKTTLTSGLLYYANTNLI